MTDYKLGEVKIGATTYTTDLVVCSNGFISPWRRKEGHNLCVEDLTYFLHSEPAILAIGTGMDGIMKISKEVKYQLFKLMPNTTFSFTNTKDAILAYNYWHEHYDGQEELVLGAFHLYC